MGKEINLGVPNQMGENPFQTIVDIGKVTFSTTDSQATYRTKLLNIEAAFATKVGTTSLATDSTTKDWVNIPLGAVSSGSITVTRSSAGTSAAQYSILLVGNKYTAAP